MKWIKKILKKFNGLYYPQEYLCLAKESFQHPLHVYFIGNNKIIKDITHSHIFVGYNPLILVLNFVSEDLHPLSEVIEIVFTQTSLPLNENLKKKDAIARLSLQIIQKHVIEGTHIFYYEGIKGAHYFLSPFHQYIIGLSNRLFNKRPGNVFLSGNLYMQVQIAYAIPRIISLITVSNGSLYNLFPTDLHGALGESYYCISLRQNGKACKQVESAGRIVISQMQGNAYKMVYALGKNHMQDLKPQYSFPFTQSLSKTLGLPLPESTSSYRELELIESFEQGIHKILVFKILSQQILDQNPATLAHIHNVYATWRHNKGLAGNYLLR
jgi:flavin reductase (DIM6/NTAB) family NADH-FMN oxidoreductase RutF